MVGLVAPYPTESERPMSKTAIGLVKRPLLAPEITSSGGHCQPCPDAPPGVASSPMAGVGTGEPPASSESLD
jgi:hypothetical protein